MPHRLVRRQGLFFGDRFNLVEVVDPQPVQKAVALGERESFDDSIDSNRLALEMPVHRRGALRRVLFWGVLDAEFGQSREHTAGDPYLEQVAVGLFSPQLEIHRDHLFGRRTSR